MGYIQYFSNTYCDDKDRCATYTKGYGHNSVSLHQLLMAHDRNLRVSRSRILQKATKAYDKLKITKNDVEYFYQLVHKDYLDKIEKVFERYPDEPNYAIIKTLMIGQIRKINHNAIKNWNGLEQIQKSNSNVKFINRMETWKSAIVKEVNKRLKSRLRNHQHEQRLSMDRIHKALEEEIDLGTLLKN